MKLNIKSEAAAGIVAGASFIASAGHIVTVVNETNALAFALVYPIGIDGLLYVGIRAVQTGRRVAGVLAILVGAFFSLAFNADAENALTMPRLMVAASMPVCMVVAFVIEGTAKKAKPIEDAPAPVAAPQIVYPTLLPIVPPAAKPVKIRATVETPKPKAIAAPSTGRVASWDVEKTVGLIEDGRTDGDVLATVDGLTAKPLQRTKRAVRLLAEDASRTDVEVATVVGQSAAHIARVRAAMKG
jgi:uncharacterized protein DUF2637